MCKRIVAMGLLMTALTVLVFVGRQAVAEPDANAGATTGESSPSSGRRAKVAAGPNANAVLSLDIDASDNKMDDGNTSGTVAGAGTDVVVEVFISGLAGPISGGVLSFDTDLLTVKSVALGAGFPLGTATTASISIGILPPADLTNGHLATVTFTTASDVTGMEFKVGASVSNLSAASGGTDMLTAAMPLTFNARTPTPTPDNAVLSLDIDASDNKMDDGNTSGTVAGSGTDVVVEVFISGLAGPINGGVLSFDTEMLTVKSVALGAGFLLGTATTANISIGIIPAASLTNGHLATVTFTTASDVTGMEFQVGASVSNLSAASGGTDMLTAAMPLTFNARTPTPTPDFDGDGTVGFSDFLAFSGQFGSSRGDGIYQVRYDLNSDGAIDFPDFLIFIGSYGGPGSPPGGGGGSSSPDLIVESPSVSDNTLTTGQSFTLRATVRNSGTGRSASTTLRYYRSSNSTISTSDTQVGTDSVSGLSASGTSAESISLTAPSSSGTYYYGACVASVSGESNSNNNCSDGVRVTVSSGSGGGRDDHSNTRSGATSLSLGGSRSGQIETGGDVDYFRVQVSTSGTLTVYTTGNTDTYGTLQNSSGSALENDDDDGDGTNFSIARAVSAGTYYVEVKGYNSAETGSYTLHARFVSGSGGGGSSRPDLIVQSPSVSDNTLTTGQSFTLRATVRNSGTGSAAATTLRYYRSSNSSISTSDTEVGTDSVSGLSASGTSSESISLTAPSSSGTYYYGACVASVSGESNSNNNCSDGVRVTVSSSPPDLIVQSPSVSDNTLTTGQSFTLRATVRNSGTGRSASTTLRYYRSSNSTIATSDTEVGTDSVSGLSASGTSAESISLTAPSSSGTYYYGACVASVSGESNSNNNCSDGVRVTVSSSRPDLIVQSPSVSDNTLTTGQSFTLRATVRNSGTGRSASTTLRYYRSSNSSISTSDTEVGTDSVSGLSASGTSAESISLTAPSSSGTYYYGACVASVSGESNTNNNCSDGVRVTVSSSRPDLIVQSPSVSDNTLTTGQSFTLRATVRNSGTGRSASTTLRYYRSSNSTISTSDTQVGTDSVSGLSASGTSAESISLTAPSSSGTYYYGACVASVSGESNTNNNCSDGVRVTVSSGNGGGSGVGDAITGSITNCSGSRDDLGVNVRIDVTLRAHREVRILIVTGYANNSYVDSKVYPSMSAGQSRNIILSGFISTSANTLSCSVKWEGTVLGSNLRGTIKEK